MSRSSPDAPVRFKVGWGDLDANNHMANVAFLGRATDTRFEFFDRLGFPGSRFAIERIGPVVLREEISYRRELRLQDEFTVDLKVTGISPDGICFSMQHTFRDASGQVAAVVTSEGLWFDLESRRPRVPSAELDATQRALPRADSYKELTARKS